MSNRVANRAKLPRLSSARFPGRVKQIPSLAVFTRFDIDWIIIGILNTIEYHTVPRNSVNLFDSCKKSGETLQTTLEFDTTVARFYFPAMERIS